MKKLALAALLVSVPFVSFAVPLTQTQAQSLINVVQSSPGTPASAFTNLITAFSNITVVQADSLIGVVQAAPGVAANAFVNLLVSFTQDTQQVAATQNPFQATQNSPVVTPTPQPTVVPTQQRQGAQPSVPSNTATSINTPASSAPWVKIQVNGSHGPVNLTQGNTATVSWSSQGAISCQIGGIPKGNYGTSGSQIVSFQEAYNTVDIQCSAIVNNLPIANAISDSVTITTQGTAALSESLSASLSPADPASDLIPQGVSCQPIGKFTFTAKDSSYHIYKVTIRIPSSAASSIAYIAASGGVPATSGQANVVTGNSDAAATIDLGGMYVPANGSTDLSVCAGTTQGAVPGTQIQATLDTGINTGGLDAQGHPIQATFRAIDVAGGGVTQINGGIPVISGGVHTVESLADYKKSLGLN